MATQQEKLLSWYRACLRPLPWRKNRDPYSIWISETMLQQTTTQAVIPFFEKFLKRFPRVEDLAEAEIEDVLEMWAGLGYYSRARNLHKAARELKKNFPRTHLELLAFPGFGPYTARAVASLAFGESCGVLDGNVIRVLSRIHDLNVEWWKPAPRAKLQKLVDAWVADVPSQDMNQALMELGATICTPQSPACLLCPLHSDCLARERGTIAVRPTKRPRRDREVWIWNAHVVENRGRILLIKGAATPFLKKDWLLPGAARQASKAPKKFDFKHTITHHDIFVTVTSAPDKLALTAESKWIPITELSRHVPASLVRKALSHYLDLQRNHAGRLSRRKE